MPERLQVWIDARKRHHLSHAQVQMARELGMNPKKLGELDDHRQEPWKLPLPEFIEHLYVKRFGKRRPDLVVSIEERARKEEDKKALKREMKRRRAVGDVQTYNETLTNFVGTLSSRRLDDSKQGFAGRGDDLGEEPSWENEGDRTQRTGGWGQRDVNERDR